MNYIILDTNIYIHFRDFDQIKWREMIKSDEDFKILIPPIVIDELDGHKYSKNPKISKRVKRILPKIEEHLASMELLELINSRPKIETFTLYQLDKNIADDRLLATILEIKDSLSENDKLIFISNDTGPRLKAESLSITSIKMNGKYQFPEEIDGNIKRIQKLESELLKYRSQLPNLVLNFTSNNDYYKYSKKKEFKTKEEFISELMKDVKMNYPLLKNDDSKIKGEKLQRILNFSLYTDEQISEYNSKLESFFNDYIKYYSAIHQLYSYKNDCAEIQLVLRNDGTAPAKDIDLELYFPDGFELHTEEGLPKLLPEPKPPYKPKNRFDYYSPHFFPQINFDIPKIQERSTNFNAPTIRKTNSYYVDFHLQHLKHNQSYYFETLFLKYANRNLAKNFKIEYKLMVGNYPDVISGKLNVIFG